MNTRNIQNLFAVIIATVVVAYSQPALAKAPILTSIVTEFPIDAQLPYGCLDELLSGSRVYENCVVEGKSTECDKRSAPHYRKATACTSTISIKFVADSVKVSPLSTNCYDVGIEDRVDSRDGVVMSIEAIGNLCLTPQGNFIAADASCRSSDSSGKITDAVGDFRGYFIEADPTSIIPTQLRAIHNESVP